VKGVTLASGIEPSKKGKGGVLGGGREVDGFYAKGGSLRGSASRSLLRADGRGTEYLGASFFTETQTELEYQSGAHQKRKRKQENLQKHVFVPSNKLLLKAEDEPALG